MKPCEEQLNNCKYIVAVLITVLVAVTCLLCASVITTPPDDHTPQTYVDSTIRPDTIKVYMDDLSQYGESPPNGLGDDGIYRITFNMDHPVDDDAIIVYDYVNEIEGASLYWYPATERGYWIISMPSNSPLLDSPTVHGIENTTEYGITLLIATSEETDAIIGEAYSWYG